MSRPKGEYEITTKNGDVHVFPSLRTRSQFVSNHLDLFDELPLIVQHDAPIEPLVDTRYIEPKAPPTAKLAEIEEIIKQTEIYRRTRVHLNKIQRKQVAYGMQKYPEPLNADTWSTIETIDHIIDESMDKLHYLVMLRIKLEQTTLKEETTCSGS
jgi:hypothetical protein